MSGRLAVLLLALVALAAAVAPAPLLAADGWAVFGTPAARSAFSSGVTFTQPVTVDQDVLRVELLLTFAESPAATVIEVPAPPRSGSLRLEHDYDPSVEGHLVPNTSITARWRLIGVEDPASPVIGPQVRITYADDRFEWRTEAGELVRVHWYEGSNAFGTRALSIGEDAVREASELLQVTETDPVDFFVYADQAAFYDALGPGTRENVGGVQIPGLRTMFALITPGEINDAWVAIVVPHELTHLVFETAAGNPYHFPPRWLNEGLAVYLSQGYDASDRGQVEAAAGAGTLIPLDGLVGQFPTSFDRFSLAYAESVSAIDYMLRAHGRDPLVSLIRSYAQGRTDDEAFEAALGQDMTAFGAAWLADLGAAAPTTYGPQPAPAGPVPSAWLGEAGGSPLPASSGRQPAASAGASVAPEAPTPADGGSVALDVALVVVLTVGLIVLVVLVARRSGRARQGVPPA